MVEHIHNDERFGRPSDARVHISLAMSCACGLPLGFLYVWGVWDVYSDVSHVKVIIFQAPRPVGIGMRIRIRKRTRIRTRIGIRIRIWRKMRKGDFFVASILSSVRGGNAGRFYFEVEIMVTFWKTMLQRQSTPASVLRQVS